MAHPLLLVKTLSLTIFPTNHPTTNGELSMTKTALMLPQRTSQVMDLLAAPKTAWVFPGQGSQEVGMGLDLLNTSAARIKFALAEEVLGWSIPAICQGDESTLSRTLYTQPCLYVVESILADLMRERGYFPQWVAGHSLGEYVALYVAGVYGFETGLRLVKYRSELMDSAKGGVMVALMQFDRDALEKQVKQVPGVVIANDNSPMQVVISGTSEAVENVLSKVKVKRVTPLPVSGAFHSPLMAEAAAQFERLLELVPFNTAKIPVLSNVDPEPTQDSDVLKERLRQQMTGPVRWREIALHLDGMGVERVVEVGPRKILTGLLKRICTGLELENVSGVVELPDDGQNA